MVGLALASAIESLSLASREAGSWLKFAHRVQAGWSVVMAPDGVIHQPATQEERWDTVVIAVDRAIGAMREAVESAA